MVYPPGLRGTCSGLPTGFERGRLWGHFILCSTPKKVSDNQKELLERGLFLLFVCVCFLWFSDYTSSGRYQIQINRVCVFNATQSSNQRFYDIHFRSNLRISKSMIFNFSVRKIHDIQICDTFLFLESTIFIFENKKIHDIHF